MGEKVYSPRGGPVESLDIYDGDAGQDAVSPPTSPAEGTGKRQRRSAKRKSTHPVVVSSGSKRSSAERRRTLRNERMATIDYAELVLRLSELVSEVGVEKVTLEGISKLYQVRRNARVTQSCGSGHG